MSRTLHILLLTVVTLQMSIAYGEGKGGEGGGSDHSGGGNTGGGNTGGGDTGGNNGGGDTGGNTGGNNGGNNAGNNGGNHGSDRGGGRGGNHSGNGGDGGYRDHDGGGGRTVTPTGPGLFQILFGKRPKEPNEPQDRKPPRKPEKEPRGRTPRPPKRHKRISGETRSCDDRYPHIWKLKQRPTEFSVLQTLHRLQGRGDADILHRCLAREYKYMPPLGRKRTQVLISQMNQRFTLSRRTVVKPYQAPRQRPVYHHDKDETATVSR